jgi:hypothetical protein
MAEMNIKAAIRPYPRCYVYIHFDPRKLQLGEPLRVDHEVYVGKGTRARAWVDTRSYSPDRGRWLRDIRNQEFSRDRYVRIEFQARSSEEARKPEKSLIAFYRDKGALLFNKEKGWKGTVRIYQNKWFSDPEFGKLKPQRQLPHV